MSHFIVLDPDDIVIDHSSIESRLDPGHGEYVIEVSDQHRIVLGERLGPPPECEGQEPLSLGS